MVGVFYASPAENASPYVSAGDRVSKGQVLCIIEAMKLMNEIVAEEDGIIEEVCVTNGQPDAPASSGASERVTPPTPVETARTALSRAAGQVMSLQS